MHAIRRTWHIYLWSDKNNSVEKYNYYSYIIIYYIIDKVIKIYENVGLDLILKSKLLFLISGLKYAERDNENKWNHNNIVYRIKL